MLRGIRFRGRRPTVGQQAFMCVIWSLLVGMLLSGGVWYAVGNSRMLNRPLHGRLH